jgi:hypothetical protein
MQESAFGDQHARQPTKAQLLITNQLAVVKR